MKKYFFSLAIVFVCAIMSACTEKTDHSTFHSDLIDVEILLPETILINQENRFQVRVTQEEENVDDAEDIQFEIWKTDSNEESQLIQAQHEKEGLYSITITFEEEGHYTLQTHVTARYMHAMPEKEFVVGN